MAIKEKTESKVNRVVQYIKEEHKWENYAFVVISAITLLLGVLILTDILTVRESFPVIGEFADTFAWVLVIISTLGLIFALYPFFKPAWPELKKVTWLKPRAFLNNSLRVFAFITIFALLFLLYDSFLLQVVKRIFSM